MFYLSKGEQVALLLLVTLLLAGAGVLTYQRGARAGHGHGPEPLFVEAEPRSASVPGQDRSDGTADSVTGGPGVVGPLPGPVAAARSPSRSQSGSPAQLTKSVRLLSLNAATPEDLEALPGIGPVLAGHIIQYRETLKKENGRGFTSADELLNVPGIGPKRFSAIRDRVEP